MEELRTTQEVQGYICKNEGKTVGLVPTMGYLHAGHESLIAASVKENDVTLVSVFVNPTQFAPGEDLESYPRSEERDKAICKKIGCDAVFVPKLDEVYGSEFGTWVETEVGRAGRNENSEGACRPNFFRGVATMVTKLVCLVRPNRIYFGQKDAQQATVVMRLLEDLWLDKWTSLRVCETVREEDGLAMSSRNTYLTKEERKIAGALWRGMQAGRNALMNDAGNDAYSMRLEADRVREIVRDHIESEWGRMQSAELIYVSVCDRFKFLEVSGQVEKGKTLLCVAGKLGSARLIDNILL